MNADSQDSSDTISLAAVAGMADEIHGRIIDRLVESRSMSRSERADAASSAIENVQASGSISEREAELLRAVHAHVVNVDATDPEIARSVRSIYDEEIPRGLSPVAEVVLRVAADSTSKEAQQAIEEGRADETGDGPIAAADVQGAAEGAAVGAAIADATGAVIGAIVGAAAYSAAEAVHELTS